MNLLKSFRLRLFEECPSEGTGERLKLLLIDPTTVERMFFLESLGLCELSFAMVESSRVISAERSRLECIS